LIHLLCEKYLALCVRANYTKVISYSLHTGEERISALYKVFVLALKPRKLRRINTKSASIKK